MPETGDSRGRRAERIAAWRLRLAGYRLLARRYRTSVGEIDLVARRGRRLVMVEVKARPTEALARQAVPERQRRRIEMAARRFLAANPRYRDYAVRFDVIAVVPGRLPIVIPDAWRDGDGRRHRVA
ncbi:MAG: YraN family protein [Alphaproteobacteria bacterium]|nr:YraN family protein [Alphaproteobacteria bacterium]